MESVFFADSTLLPAVSIAQMLAESCKEVENF